MRFNIFPSDGASFSVSDTLGLDLISNYEPALHPIEIPSVSARQVVVAVYEDAHVLLRMVENRRMTASRNEADVLHVPRRRLLPLLRGVAGAVKTQQQLPDLSFLSLAGFPREDDKDVALLFCIEVRARRTSLTVISLLSCGLTGSMMDACEMTILNASSGGADAYRVSSFELLYSSATSLDL